MHYNAQNWYVICPNFCNQGTLHKVSEADSFQNQNKLWVKQNSKKWKKIVHFWETRLQTVSLQKKPGYSGACMQGGASGMEGALTLIFCKSEISRDIKK